MPATGARSPAASKGVHFRVHGKGDKIRYIPVGLIAQRLINDYLEAAKHKADLDGALFRPVKNNISKTLAKHLHPDSVYQQIVKALRGRGGHKH